MSTWDTGRRLFVSSLKEQPRETQSEPQLMRERRARGMELWSDLMQRYVVEPSYDLAF